MSPKERVPSFITKRDVHRFQRRVKGTGDRCRQLSTEVKRCKEELLDDEESLSIVRKKADVLRVREVGDRGN